MPARATGGTMKTLRYRMLKLSLCIGLVACAPTPDDNAGPAEPTGDHALAEALTLHCMWSKQCHRVFDESSRFEPGRAHPDQECLRELVWPRSIAEARATGLAQDVLAAAPCMRSATTCDELTACLDPDALCAPHERRCEGDRLVSCDGIEMARTQDCGRSAAHCGPRDSSPGFTCVPDGPDTPRQRCDGDVLTLHFRDGGGEYKLITMDCRVLGLSCHADHGCLAPPGPPCLTEDFQFCQGDSVVECIDGRLRQETNCAELAPGTTCVEQETPPFAACGRPPEAAECESPLPYEPSHPRCDGDTLWMCWTGTRLEFDCTEVGGTCMAAGEDGWCETPGP